MNQRVLLPVLAAPCLVLGMAATADAAVGSTPQAGTVNAASQWYMGAHLAPGGTVFGSAEGVDRYVSTAEVGRTKASTDGICDYQGRIEIFRSSTLLYGRNSPRRPCVHFRTTVSFGVYQNFPSATRICLSFWEEGVRQGPRMCDDM